MHFHLGRKSFESSLISLVGHALDAIGDDLRVLAAKDYFFNTTPRRFNRCKFHLADDVRLVTRRKLE